MLMNCFIGKKYKNATFEDVRNLLPFKVTRPEQDNCFLCDVLVEIIWSWLLSFCFIVFVTFEQCQGHTQDHRSMTKQIDATPAVFFASPGGTSKGGWSWQLVQSERSTRAEDPRILGLLQSPTSYKITVRVEDWKEMHMGPSLLFLTSTF